MMAHDALRALEGLLETASQREQIPSATATYFIEVPASSLVSMSVCAEIESPGILLREWKSGIMYSRTESGMNCAHEKSGRSGKWD